MTKPLLGVAILLVTIILIFVFLAPSYDQLKAVKSVLEGRETLLANAKLARDNIILLDKQYGENSEAIKRLLIALPVGKEVDYLTSSINTATADSGVLVSAISFSDPIKKENYQEIPIKMDVSCSYLDCINFMRSLELSLRLYDVKKISITQSSQGESLLNLSMNLSAYSIK